MKHRLWLVLAGALLSGCAPEYTYLPVTGATIAGSRVAVQYNLPNAAAPRGILQLVSYDVVELGPDTRAIHVRAVVINNDTTSWTLDPREQSVEVAGTSEGARAQSRVIEGHGPPLVTVPSGTKRVVDLYFDLPRDLWHLKHLPAFDLMSTVHTPDGPSTHRTPFQRFEVMQPPDYDGPTQSWGAPNWNPFYYSYPFYGP
jgi:hypothetical protein